MDSGVIGQVHAPRWQASNDGRRLSNSVHLSEADLRWLWLRTVEFVEPLVEQIPVGGMWLQQRIARIADLERETDWCSLMDRAQVG